MNSHRPRSQNTSKEQALIPEKESRRTWPRCHISLEKSSKNHKPMSQTKPLPWRHTTAGELLWRVFSADLPRGEPRSARIICRFFSPSRMAKLGERAGWSAIWSSSLTGWEKSAKFKLKMVSDVLLLSYLDKIGLSLTVEARQASAYLYKAI